MRPRRGSSLCGWGLPLKVNSYGRDKEFHDGAGLCSPGPWAPKMRSLDDTGLAGTLRARILELLCQADQVNYKRILATMLAGKCREDPFGPVMIHKARNIFFEEVERASGRCFEHVPEPGHCYFLTALGDYLYSIGDPDWRCLEQGSWSFAKGRPVGICIRMPRTPAVYERKVKWRKYDGRGQRAAALEAQLRVRSRSRRRDRGSVPRGGEAADDEGDPGC